MGNTGWSFRTMQCPGFNEFSISWSTKYKFLKIVLLYFVIRWDAEGKN